MEVLVRQPSVNLQCIELQRHRCMDMHSLPALLDAAVFSACIYGMLKLIITNMLDRVNWP